MNLFEAEQQATQDAVTTAILIDESNLAAHLNHYDDHALIKLLASGKKFLRLKDGIGYRHIESEDISIQIANDVEFTIELINKTLEGDSSIEEVRKMVNDEIYGRISAALDEIKEDYEDLLHGIG